MAEDFAEAERRLVETGRDGRRLPPATVMRIALPVSAVLGLSAGLAAWWFTRGDSDDAQIVRVGLTQIAIGSFLLCCLAVPVVWLIYERVIRWYLRNPPYPNVMRYRTLRYRAVMPSVWLFFTGPALVLGGAWLAAGHSLADLL